MRAPNSLRFLSVVVTKSMVRPESHETFKTGHIGGTSDRGSVHGEYLHNQKNVQHETNFHGFYTPAGVHNNWNFKKNFTEHKVMDFTSQPIYSASNGPDQPYFGPPTMKRPRLKLFIMLRRVFKESR